MLLFTLFRIQISHNFESFTNILRSGTKAAVATTSSRNRGTTPDHRRVLHQAPHQTMSRHQKAMKATKTMTIRKREEL